MKNSLKFVALFSVLACSSSLFAQAKPPGLGPTWTAIQNVPNIQASAPTLLQDGSVLIHNGGATDWWKLTPDINGNYSTGTWTQVATPPDGYSPLYFASAVLPDGKVIVEGGEYNDGSTTSVETNQGAIYDPVANSWTAVNPPTGWSQIGDSVGVVLANGQFMLAQGTGFDTAILDESNLTWTVTTGQQESLYYNNEQSWTLLPDGSVFTVSVWDEPASLRYLPTEGTWINGGTASQNIVDLTNSEVGPQLLGYDGKVFCAGGNGNNVIYTPPTTLTGTGSFTNAPSFPLDSNTSNPELSYDMADAPGCVLPNGNMLFFTSPGYANSGGQFFLWNGSTLTEVAGTPNTPGDSSYYGNMLLLPNGQMLFTDLSNDVELYTPVGSPQASWKPMITSCPSAVAASQSFTLSGTQLNGLVEGSGYGDDFQNNSNYPIVRITNNASGHVFYCRTTNPSTMGVATGNTVVSATVIVPSTIENGASTIQVVANGIASTAQPIDVGATLSYFTLATPCVGGEATSGYLSISMDAPTGGGAVTLSSNSVYAIVPSSATVPAGKSTVSFVIQTKNPTAATYPTISATYGGVTKTAILSINHGPAAASITVPASCTGGATVAASFTATAAAGRSGGTATVSSNSPNAKVPATIPIYSGETGGSFSIVTEPVSVATTATITVVYGGVGKYSGIVINPPALSGLSLASPTTGGSTTTGTISLTGKAPTGGMAVTVTSSDPTLATITSPVTVAAGQSTASFNISTAHETGTVYITITAKLGSVTKTATLRVNPS